MNQTAVAFGLAEASNAAPVSWPTLSSEEIVPISTSGLRASASGVKATSRRRG